MQILDPGHKYKLATIDGDVDVILTFVKREGLNYPGNTGHYAGAQIQEVCRVLIDRIKYVDKQIHCKENLYCIEKLRSVIRLLERRAFMRHQCETDLMVLRHNNIEELPVNSHGHLWTES